ncbi:hypothetical protein [Microbacterium algeriense]|uniref:hypothetical protein n=1 Tax=Microbacterium algeriense TaxID=2615184 RepID=UPI0029ABFD76|nr:hypothetical protein [Microbacterium algeriense]MDX2401481.1 hypothetical protein [Microbacterium algeriense]
MLSRTAAQAMGLREDLWEVPLDYLPITQPFSPDVVLIREGGTQIEIVIETKLSASAQATSRVEVERFSKRDGAPDASEVHAVVATGYGVSGGKRNAAGGKPEGIWQIDGYFGWKWWEKQFPEYTVAPDMKFIYLHSKAGQTATSMYKGAPSAKHWDAVSLEDLVIDLNRELRREQEGDLVLDKSDAFTQDEKDAIAVLTFLVYTHLAVDHVSPHAWVESTLNLTTT